MAVTVTESNAHLSTILHLKLHQRIRGPEEFVTWIDLSNYSRKIVFFCFILFFFSLQLQLIVCRRGPSRGIHCLRLVFGTFRTSAGLRPGPRAQAYCLSLENINVPLLYIICTKYSILNLHPVHRSYKKKLNIHITSKNYCKLTYRIKTIRDNKTKRRFSKFIFYLQNTC